VRSGIEVRPGARNDSWDLGETVVVPGVGKTVTGDCTTCAAICGLWTALAPADGVPASVAVEPAIIAAITANTNTGATVTLRILIR
jgi:hypothetical protein